MRHHHLTPFVALLPLAALACGQGTIETVGGNRAGPAQAQTATPQTATVETVDAFKDCGDSSCWIKVYSRTNFAGAPLLLCNGGEQATLDVSGLSVEIGEGVGYAHVFANMGFAEPVAAVNAGDKFGDVGARQGFAGGVRSIRWTCK